MDEQAFRKILVGYDGSEGSEKAAELAAVMAKRFDAVIVVCYAFGHMPLTSKPSEIRRLVDPLVERLTKEGITTKVSLPDEVPAQGILESATQHHADLIVLGSRGRGAFAELLLGSTAERVLQYAKIPVLIAR